MKKNILVGCAIAALFLFFYSCSDLIGGVDGAGPAAPGSITVATGMVDSLEALRVQYDSTRYVGMTVIFPKVSGSDHYDIRVLSVPITQENWGSAVPVAYRTLSSDSVNTTVSIRLRPTIVWNNCTGCGECVKPRSAAVHRPWRKIETEELTPSDSVLTENPDPRICPRNAIVIVAGKAQIDPDECTGCGEGYKVCPHQAVTDCSFGRFYYVGIKAVDRAGSSPAPISTNRAFKLLYDNWVTRPGLFPSLPPIAVCQHCNFGGCFANQRVYSRGMIWTDTSVEFDNDKLLTDGGPFIEADSCKGSGEFGGCPVGAIYTDSDPASKRFKAIYIDPNKCINCGICFERCLNEGKHSIIRKVISNTGN